MNGTRTRSERRAMPSVLLSLVGFSAVLTSTTPSGQITLVPFLLSVLATGLLFRKAVASQLDRRCWTFGFLALLAGTLAYAAMGFGVPVENPIVVALFVVTYPLLTAVQVTFVRVRLVTSQLPNWLDGGIAACLATVVLFQWVVPRQVELGKVGWPLFVGILFPVLGSFAFAAMMMFASAVKWKLPPVLKLIIAAQVTFLLADLLPLFITDARVAIGARLGALANVLLIGAVRADDAYSFHDGTPSARRTFLVVWGVGITAVVLLLHPSVTLWGKSAAAIAIVLVGLRMSLAYGEVRDAVRLRAEARTDELTGLGNRRALREKLGHLITERRRFAVLLLDLDDFKVTNDTLGHEAGDQMLSTVSARLRRVEREHGLPIELFRLGGDEFAALAISPLDAEKLAHQIADLIRIPTRIAGERIDQQVSVGISLYPDDATEPGELLRLADTAMYRAKQLRTVVEVHSNESLEHGINSLRILAVLRDALRTGLFELHYQPQVHLRDGLAVGVEALFRLPYGDGYLPAAAVIAAAERASIMSELTDAVLDRSLKQLSTLLIDQPALSLSFNVSEQDFSSGTLAARVLAAVDRHQVSPSQVCVEVTEESLVHDTEAAVSAVETLRSAGLTVAMDDFGVGFSSLTNLRLLAVDELKIDRSFVAGLTTDRRTEALVITMVELARRLGAKVVIEGIETDDEVAVARSMGVDVVQGYVFARPMPFEQLEVWLGSNRASRDATTGQLASGS